MLVEISDFFEIYAPVVQRTTVCFMLILENLLGLNSKQVDVTATFLHATLEEDEKVYVEMPLGSSSMVQTWKVQGPLSQENSL